MKRTSKINPKLTDNEDGKMEKPTRKYPGFRKNIYNYFTEYSNNTGIHGFKYMGEQERTLAEKLLWLIFLCISLYFCTDLIIQTWIKWEQSPVLVSFAESPTPIWQVPFPAITICPQTKARQTKYNYTENFHKFLNAHSNNYTAEEFRKFSDASLICNDFPFEQGNKTTGFESIEFLKNISPPIEKVFFSCKYASVNGSCDTWFTKTITEDGVCYSFNLLDRPELFTEAYYLPTADMNHGHTSDGWSLEDGYPVNTEKDTYPFRALSVGSGAGFFVLLSSYDQDMDFLCRGPVQGFKILLHHPAEMPRVGTQYFRAPLNQEIVVAVKPDMMTTSKGLKDYDPHRRQCFFGHERQLYFFQTYTQQNCQVECLANYTNAKCGCVAYHMPRDKSMAICGSGSSRCVLEAETELLSKEAESEISRFDSGDNSEITSCDCLPSCTSINYNAETSQAFFNWPKVFDAYKANRSEFPGIQMTRITIFFKELQFITSERNELYGQTDFLANCGGLLGLFTGFSFLSIVEIIYFLTLRLICNVHIYGRHFWSGSEALIKNDAYLHH